MALCTVTVAVGVEETEVEGAETPEEGEGVVVVGAILEKKTNQMTPRIWRTYVNSSSKIYKSSSWRIEGTPSTVESTDLDRRNLRLRFGRTESVKRGGKKPSKVEVE